MESSSWVESLLHDVESLENNLNSWLESCDDENSQLEKGSQEEIRILKLDLKFMKTFLKCTRKWSQKSGFKKDRHGLTPGSLPSAINPRSRLEYLNHSREPAAFPYLLSSEVKLLSPFTELDLSASQIQGGESNPVEISPISTKLDWSVSRFQSKFESFMERINWLYIPSWYSGSAVSSLPNKEELVENLDVLAENLENILTWSKAFSQGLKVQIDALLESVKFLKNLTCFAASRGVEVVDQLEDLLAHAEIVAVNTAILCHVFWFNKDDESVCDRMQYKISNLLQKIRPVDDPEVYEIYIRVLKAESRSSASGYDLSLESNKVVVRNFNDSLLGNLWELMNSSVKFTKSSKVHMQMLYRELRFFRTVLKDEEWEKYQSNLDEEKKEHIGALLNEAGVVIFSLFVTGIREDPADETDTALADLLEKIRMIKMQVLDKYPDSSTGQFLGIDGPCFINVLLENMEELQLTKVDSVGLEKDQIQMLCKDIGFLRSFLEKIVEMRNHHEMLQALWVRVVQVAQNLHFAISSLLVEDYSDCCSVSFGAATEEIELLKVKIMEICDSIEHDMMKPQKIILTASDFRSRSSIGRTEEVVVGLDDQAEDLINKLTKGSEKLDVISIVGMAGLGKTTLAKRVYNHKSVVCRFYVRAWCHVSPVFSEKKFLLDILHGIASELPEHYVKMDEFELADELRRSLLRNKFLIVLDDVWDIRPWHYLEKLLPTVGKGSRILITSRIHEVASEVKSDSDAYFLRTLTDNESWLLLQKKLFGEESCPEELSHLGMELARNCQGLPLTVVVVAGILATVEQDDWGKVAKSVRLDVVSRTKQCMNSLELSYKHLPYYLKPCFLYFGAFPQGQSIPAWKLISLWIAEGFVQRKELKGLELEELAENYIRDLIKRNLIMVSKKRSVGTVKACHIHDLLHEFCIAKSKEENFQQLLHGYTELSNFDEPQNLHRFSIYSKPEDFVKSRLFCPRVYSLLFYADHHGLPQNWYNISFIFRFFRLLTVLDVSEINLGDSFPRETELLVWLRYLAVCGKMRSIPPSIVKLSYLETLVAVGLYDNISLPNTIWKMKKLRHIRMTSCSFSFILPCENLEDSSQLCSLDTLSTAYLSFEHCKTVEMVMRKFPQIQKLKCILKLRNWRANGDCNTILSIDFLKRLKTFNVSCIGASKNPFEIGFPSSLKKLTLSSYYQPWSKISTIGKLPNLEVLELLDKSFQGEEWNMEEGQFPKLRVLKLDSLALVRWRGSSDDDLPCLQKLVLQRCVQLQEVPSCLYGYAPLEMIEVRWCERHLVSLVRYIKEEHEGMGNVSLKIFIHPTEEEEEKREDSHSSAAE